MLAAKGRKPVILVTQDCTAIDLLSKYLGTRSFDWPRGATFALRDRQSMARDRGNLNFTKDNVFACLPSFHFLSGCSCPKLMYFEGKPPALFSLWRSGNPFKSLKTTATSLGTHPRMWPFYWYQLRLGQQSVSPRHTRKDRERRGLEQKWTYRVGSSLERCVVISGERVPTSLLEPLGVAAWVFLCPPSWQWVQTSLRSCEEKSSRFIAEEITTASIPCPAEFRNWHETPTPSHVAPSTGTLRSTMIRDMWERWRRKEPANNRRGYKSFFLNPPTETVRHG